MRNSHARQRIPAASLASLNMELTGARDQIMRRYLVRLAESNPGMSTLEAVRQFEEAWHAAVPLRRPS